jgi:hypothetical protein
MSNSARKYPLFVNEFFMKGANSFMKTVMKNALQLEQYWGHVEFAPQVEELYTYMLWL